MSSFTLRNGVWGVVLSFFCGGGREQRMVYIYREGGKEMCVHEEERERRRRKRREEEEEEGLHLFLHCWKSGGCLQLGWFGSCCKEDREQHTKLYHTMYCSTHKQSK